MWLAVERLAAVFRRFVVARGAPSTPAEELTSNWCLVGNVVDEHPFGTDREARRGSKHFGPGTKVYCLPPQWGDGYEKAVVVGLHRGSRRWVTVVMPTSLIFNWRAKEVYKPAVLSRLRRGFKDFRRQWKSRSEVESYAQSLRGQAQRSEGRP